MDPRTLGRTGLHVSPLCLGAMMFGAWGEPDHDVRVREGLRFVQLTPPGSACSIALGEGVVDAEPGSVAGLQLVVPDARAAREELLGRGVDVGEVEDLPWGSFVFFADPDGNRWSVQELPPREG